MHFNGTRPEVSVVIPTYNRSEMLRDALEHLTQQHLPPSRFEVIVSDDGSTDATAEVVDSFAGRLQLKYAFQEDLGYRVAAARNAGARLATAPLLVILDTGPLFGPDFLQRHLAAHPEDAPPRAVVGYAYGYNPDRDMTWLHEPLRELGPVGTVARYAHDPQFRDIRHDLLSEIDFDLSRRRSPWQLFFTINASVPTEVFWEVGGFDEGWDGWGAEDFELGYRLHRHGLQFHLARDAWVVDVPHERDQVMLRRELARQMGHFLSLHREPQIEIGWALIAKDLMWSWEDDYSALLEWQERARSADVADEIAEALRGLPEPGRIAVLGCGAKLPADLPPCIVADFDKAKIDQVGEGAAHTRFHALGLRIPLPDKAVDTVIITSRLSGMWQRWGDDILREANRIGHTVRGIGEVTGA